MPGRPARHATEGDVARRPASPPHSIPWPASSSGTSTTGRRRTSGQSWSPRRCSTASATRWPWNTLALAQATAAQTLKHRRSNDAFNTAYSERLQALSLSNRLLLGGDRQSASIEALPEGGLAAHAGPDGGRFRLAGPALQIDSRTPPARALVIHELATNAANRRPTRPNTGPCRNRAVG